MGSSPDSSGFPSFHPFYHSLSFTTIRKRLSETFHFWQPLLLLFTRCATSNASRHFKSPLAMGRDAFKPKHASSVSISEVIDTGVNSNLFFTYSRNLPGLQQHDIRQTPFFGPGSSCTVPIHHRCRSCYHKADNLCEHLLEKGLA